MRLGESGLQLLQLVAGERRAESALLPLHGLSVTALALALRSIALGGFGAVLFRGVAFLRVFLVEFVGHLCRRLLHGDGHCCAGGSNDPVTSSD